jgi:hypothetical protein
MIVGKIRYWKATHEVESASNTGTGNCNIFGGEGEGRSNRIVKPHEKGYERARPITLNSTIMIRVCPTRA